MGESRTLSPQVQHNLDFYLYMIESESCKKFLHQAARVTRDIAANKQEPHEAS